MSITLEFFSGSPDEFLKNFEAWMNAETMEDEKILSDRLYALYPHVDFSFHLQWPEDFDTFCQALNVEGLHVPPSSKALLVEELWSDEVSVWVDRISQQFVDTVAHLNDDEVKRAIKRWLSYFPKGSTSYVQLYENSLRALLALRKVAQDATAPYDSLLLLRIW